MRAVVKYRQEDGNTELREIPVPQPGPGDVLIKVSHIGICGSDPHIFHGQTSFPLAIPLVLGHEFSGVIESVGSAVSEWRPGDRVTVETHNGACGRCLMCRTNNHRFCRKRTGHGALSNGCYADYVKADRSLLHRLPENVSLRDGACIEPLAVAYNVVAAKRAPVRPGDAVVVIGPGGIGLLCAKLASLAGARDVVVVGGPGDEGRLEAALQFGATAIVPHGEDPRKFTAAMNEGYGADCVIDAAGPAATLRLAIDLVRPDGCVNKVAWGPKPVDFSLDGIIQKGVTFQGSFSHTWDIWEKCIGLVAAGRVDPGLLISHELPLEDWRKGFELVESRRSLKVLLIP